MSILKCTYLVYYILQFMAQLFVPMLAREATREESLFWETQKANMMEDIGYELIRNMQRFSAQVHSSPKVT